MKKWSRIFCSAVLSLSMLLGEAIAFTDDTMCTSTASGENKSRLSVSGPAFKDENYWSKAVETYIVDNGDGTVSAVAWGADYVYVNIYRIEDTIQLISTKNIPCELGKYSFNGFYAGEKYNYFVFCQDNPEEDDTLEVIRVVKYDKQFRRLDVCSVSDCYTVSPVYYGSLRMAESGNTLIIHTARKHYCTEDGLNPQSQLTIKINTDTMSVTNTLGRFQENYVGNSFNQFVLFDGNSYILVDHGNAYPRSIVLHKSTDSGYRELDLFRISGKIGEGRTGVHIGGFEVSEENYLVAINTYDQNYADGYTEDGSYWPESTDRDVVLLVSDKANSSYDEVRNIWFTDIAGSGKFATTPFLVKIDEEHFAVLWEERRSSDDLESFGVYCVIIDGNGESCSEIKQFENARLSQSCQPIVYSNSILWYVDYYGSKRVFYEIDLTAPEDKIVFTIDDPTACVFGQSQTYDVASIIRNGRTMLPARYVAEAFGANVSWDAEKREVAIQGQDVELKLYLGSDIAYVNGEAVKLDTPAMVENGRTYTPVRFVAEHLGANVRWKADTRNVVLTMP